MSIEVKQLIVKSTLVSDESDARARAPAIDVERLKRQVMAECRKLIEQSLEARRER